MCYIERNFLKVLILVGFVLIVAVVSLAFSRGKDKTRPSRYYLAHKRTTPKPPIIRFPIENSTVYNQLEHVDGLINKWIRKKPLYRELKKCRRTLIKFEWNLEGPSKMNFLIPTTVTPSTIPTTTIAAAQQNYPAIRAQNATQNGSVRASPNNPQSPSTKDVSKYKKEMAKMSSKNDTHNETNKGNVMPDGASKNETDDSKNDDRIQNKKNKNGTDLNANGDNSTIGYSSTTEGLTLLNKDGNASNVSKTGDNKKEYYHSNETEGLISIKGNSEGRNMLDLVKNLSMDVEYDENVATTRKPFTKRVKKLRKYSIVQFLPTTTTKKVSKSNSMMSGDIL